MQSLFHYLAFQYYYWKLRSTYLEEGEWIINQESIRLFKRCFQLIGLSHFNKLTRRYLQHIELVSFCGSYKDWLEKCEQATDNLRLDGRFPSTWGYLYEPVAMSLADYYSRDGYWESPRERIIETFHHLEELYRLVEQGGEGESSYRFRKMSKLFSEAIWYLDKLLLLYKECQYGREKRREDQQSSKKY